MWSFTILVSSIFCHFFSSDLGEMTLSKYLIFVLKYNKIKCLTFKIVRIEYYQLKL